MCANASCDMPSRFRWNFTACAKCRSISSIQIFSQDIDDRATDVRMALDRLLCCGRITLDRHYLERHNNHGQRRKSSTSQTQQTSAGANSATQGRDKDILRPHNHEPHRCPRPEVSRRSFRPFLLRCVPCRQLVTPHELNTGMQSETWVWRKPCV